MFKVVFWRSATEQMQRQLFHKVESDSGKTLEIINLITL